MGVEPTTSSLGSLHSTAELHPREIPVSAQFSWKNGQSQGGLFGAVMSIFAGIANYYDRYLIEQIQRYGQHQLGGDIRRWSQNGRKNKNENYCVPPPLSQNRGIYQPNP